MLRQVKEKEEELKQKEQKVTIEKEGRHTEKHANEGEERSINQSKAEIRSLT